MEIITKPERTKQSPPKGKGDPLPADQPTTESFWRTKATTSKSPTVVDPACAYGCVEQLTRYKQGPRYTTQHGGTLLNDSECRRGWESKRHLGYFLNEFLNRSSGNIYTFFNPYKIYKFMPQTISS